MALHPPNRAGFALLSFCWNVTTLPSYPSFSRADADRKENHNDKAVFSY